MTSEELTTLFNTFAAIGDNATTAFICWLVFEYIIRGAIWLTSLYMIMRFVVRPMIMAHSSHAYLCSLRDKLNIGVPGALLDQELRDVSRRIDELLAKQESEK